MTSKIITMEEIINDVNLLQARFDKTHATWLKLEILKATTICAIDVARAIEANAPNDAVDRVEALRNQIIKIRMSFRMAQFPKGGIVRD
jgi:hypothetical protein